MLNEMRSIDSLAPIALDSFCMCWALILQLTKLSSLMVEFCEMPWQSSFVFLSLKVTCVIVIFSMEQ